MLASLPGCGVRLGASRGEIVEVLDRARVLAEGRATRIGGVMRDERRLEITKPWPDREFAGI